MEDLDEKLIVKKLAHSIQRIQLESETNVDSDKWNYSIVSMSGCFDNFECGRKALGLNIQQVLPFICHSVNKYLTELK